MEEYINLGVGIAQGIMGAIGVAVAICLVVTFIRNLFGIGMDATDKSRWSRSNVKIVTDYETGVQYLRSSGGGLHPRIDAQGKLVYIPSSERRK